MQRTLSRRIRRRGDKQAGDVYLGTPTTSLIQPRAQPAVTPLPHQDTKPHGPYRHHLPERQQLAAIMADDPASVRDATVPPDDFRDVVESAGIQLKERLLGKRDAATKTYGFDLYGIQPYLDILAPVLSHKVSGVALVQ
jgi:hypothetical protein